MLERLTMRQLRLLVALDDQRKLQQAATRLNMSQSAASKMLAEIEKTAGVQLFDRLPRGIAPTDYGEILIRRSRSILADLRHAASELEGRKAGNSGAVSIGLVAAPSTALLVQAIRELGAKLDAIKISLEVENSPILVNRLIALESDFVVARMPDTVDPRNFNYDDLDEEEACFVTRAGHPLADRSVISLRDLVDLQWVLEPRGSIIRQSFERLIRAGGIAPPRRVIDCASHLATLAIVAGTDALTAMSVPIVDHIGDRNKVKKVGIREKLTVGSYGLIQIKGRPLSPAALKVFEAIKRAQYGHRMS